MAFKDLLVHIDNSKACGKRIEAALRLAREHEAHLAALYVIPLLNIPSYAEAQVPAEVIETQRRAARADAAAAEKAFNQAARKAGATAEWRCVEEDFVQALTVHARHADLTVIGQTDLSDERAIPGLAEAVALNAGRPVLVIPYIGAAATLGERMLIAWNASREAVRAVNDALPLLQRAKKVTVLSVNPPGGVAIPGADIALHLARHGVKAEADHVEAHDIAVGDMLLSRAADKAVDLIVMGAYGHSRLRELVLGGATRHLLRHMTVPVLMSH